MTPTLHTYSFFQLYVQRFDNRDLISTAGGEQDGGKWRPGATGAKEGLKILRFIHVYSTIFSSSDYGLCWLWLSVVHQFMV